MKQSGKKKSKEELAKLAVMGFADKGKKRKELPKYVRQGPAIGSDEVCGRHSSDAYSQTELPIVHSPGRL